MQEPAFVGRECEIEELGRHLEESLAGHGQILFITGETGSGKTALVRHFAQQALAADPDLVVAIGSGNAQIGVGDPYLPFREALAMLCGDAAAQQAVGKVAPENANRLRAMMARSIQVLVEVAPELVGIFVPGGKLVGTVGKAVVTKVGWMDQLDELAKPKAASAGPMVEQNRIFEQYTAYLQHLSTKTPIILFLEDLQWADNASLGLLFQLGRNIQASRILILGAFRPNDVALGRGDGRHPLETVAHELTRYYGDITVDLDAIPATVTRQFVDAVLDSEANSLGQAFREALFHRTGGNALFTVELIRALQERGDLVRDGNGRWTEGPSLDWNTLPARVEGVIAERIARLSDELRRVLTVGSVEGEQFSAEVVARVQAVNERQAIRELSEDLQRRHRLVNADGVVQFGSLHLSLYRFLHNLFQQYLYDGLDKAERAYLHRDVGEATEALFAEQTEEVAARLARHFEESGIPAKAAAYRLQAGNRAQRMSAHEEAVAHLIRGLELVGSLPPGAEQMQLELGLQTSLGKALTPMRGYASPEVAQAFARGRELCRALGDPPELIPVLFGLCLFYMACGDLSMAREESERLLQLAQQAGDISHVIGVQYPLGTILFLQADLEDSRAHYEQCVDLYDPGRDHDLAYQQGQDPAVLSQLFLSWTLWMQGYPEQALAKVEPALKLAEQINHPYTTTLAALLAADSYHFQSDWPKCQAQAERGLELASKWHFPFGHAGCTMHRGAALARQGHLESGIEILRQGVDAWMATGTWMAMAYWPARLAEAYLLSRRREEGLAALEESLRHEEEIWWLPEQYRIRAELLLLAPGHQVEAESYLYQSLNLARSRGAKSLELRAAMSLARLLRQQGRAAEGRKLLAECYAWFTEGFHTADLQEARGLLETLEKDVEGVSATGNDQNAEEFEDLVDSAPAFSAPTSLLPGAELMGSGRSAQPEKRMSTGGS
jgi:tetratricopeptide (TPR) repeat protein